MAEGPRPPASASSSGAEILTGLRELAQQLGIEVRMRRGRRIILVDEKLGVVEQVGVVGEALGRVVPGDAAVPLALVPYLRTGHRKVLPLLRPRPLARGR
ncbi:MAG: hypothetical protein J0I07_20960 [Myxococcales bacterium]|nr:hypothetical protein [Myxococcales bacterium]